MSSGFMGKKLNIFLLLMIILILLGMLGVSVYYQNTLKIKKTELANIQAELTRVTLQKEVYKRQIDEAYIQIIGLNKTITSLNSQIYSLNREVDRLNTRVSCLRNTADSQELSSCFG